MGQTGSLEPHVRYNCCINWDIGWASALAGYKSLHTEIGCTHASGDIDVRLQVLDTLALKAGASWGPLVLRPHRAAARAHGIVLAIQEYFFQDQKGLSDIIPQESR